MYPSDPASVFQPPPHKLRQLILFWIVVSVVGLVALTLLFRNFFLTSGDHIAGNFGDARLIIYLLEHWFKVFSGAENWLSPSFYYPIPGVLGYSHTLFLQALPYSLFRACGLDVFLSFEAMLIILAMVGYLATILLLRQLQVRLIFCIVGGLLFAFSNLQQAWLLAPQMYHVLLIPCWLLLVVTVIRNRRERPILASGLAGVCGVAISLLLFSDFYTGWFFALFLLITGVAGCGCIYLLGWEIRGSIREFAKYLFIAALAGCVALLPFLQTYLPMAKQGNYRSLNEVLSSLPSLRDLIDVGRENMVWGWLVPALGGSDSGTLWTYGMPPGLMVAFFASVVILFANRRFELPLPLPIRIVLLSCGFAVLVIWALMLQDWAWTLVWKFVPGAKAVRIVQRFQLVLSIFVMLTTISVLSAMWSVAKSRVSAVAIISFLAFLCLEQFSYLDSHNISRGAEKLRLTSVSAPPNFCRAFLLRSLIEVSRHPIALQVDAMLLAQHIGLPTLNGYSGLQPRFWDLNDPHSTHYLEDAQKWSRAHELTDVCGYDTSTGEWVADAFRPSFLVRPSMNEPLVLEGSDPRLATRSEVGQKTNNYITSNGKGGYLQYGPYIPAQRGKYVAVWVGEVLAGKGELGAVEITVKGKRIKLALVNAEAVSDGVIARLPFCLDEDASDLECIFIVNEGVYVKLRVLRIEAAGENPSAQAACS